LEALELELEDITSESFTVDDIEASTDAKLVQNDVPATTVTADNMKP